MALKRALRVATAAAIGLSQAWAGVSDVQLERKVSPRMRAATARSVFAALSEMSGTPLAVEPALGEEILVVQVRDAPLSEIMSRLAFVLHGEWEKSDRGYLLRRSAAVTAESDERDRRARAARYKGLLDKKAKELASMTEPFAQAEAALRTLAEFKQKAERAQGLNLDEPLKGAPAGRLLYELAVALGPEELASLPPFRKTVYCNQANRAERPLGPHAGQLVRNYTEAEERLALLVGDKPPDSGFGKTYDQIFMAAKMPGGIGKVLLSATTYGASVGLWISIYTKSGELRSYSPGGMYDLEPNPYVEEAKVGKSQPAHWIPLSPLSAEFERAAPGEWNQFRFPMPGDKAPSISLSPRLLDALQHPETTDPLGFAATDAVLAMGRSRNLDVLACLPDSVARTAHLAVALDRLNLTRFEALLPGSGGTEVTTKDGFLLLRPSSPASTTRYRLRRPALGRFMRACVAADAVDLEPYCRLHFQAGDAMWTDRFAKVYQQVLEDAKVPSRIGRSRYSHNLYALLGSLDHALWQRLERGEGIPVASLGPASRTLAARYAEDSDLETESGETVPPLELCTVEAIPNGIPPDSVLWMDTRDIETAMSATPEFRVGNSMSVEMVPRDAAGLAGRLPLGDGATSVEEMLKDKLFRFGKDRRYDIRLRVAPGRICRTEIRGVLEDLSVKAVPYGQLSPSFRAAVAAALEGRRKGG